MTACFLCNSRSSCKLYSVRIQTQEDFITKKCIVGGTFLGLFVLWTGLVRTVDVQPIGPLGTSVGFATVNRFTHELTGVHMALYALTDWLGLIPILIAAGFAFLGLGQWIRRKSLRKVDFSILALGFFYIATAAAFLFFENHVINYRPLLIGGNLEASYPSSTTLLAICVMPTAMHQFRTRIRHPLLRRWVVCLCAAFTGFMVIGRLISGVHWFTDIVGGILLGAGLVTLYQGVASLSPAQKTGL